MMDTQETKDISFLAFLQVDLNSTKRIALIDFFTLKGALTLMSNLFCLILVGPGLILRRK